MLNLIESILVDQLPKEVTRLFLFSYPSWLSGYQAWLVWLLNKNSKFNRPTHYGDLFLLRKIAFILLKLRNFVRNRKGAGDRTCNLEI